VSVELLWSLLSVCYSVLAMLAEPRQGIRLDSAGAYELMSSGAV